MSGRTKLLATVGLGLLALALVELALFASLSPPRAIFVQVSVLGVLTALGTVAARNLVHAALYLVGFFFLVACQFILLEAEFMAAMQVLVYIGAVSILMMFGIMLTRNIQGDETTGGHWTRRLPAAVVALALLGLLIFGINGQRGFPGTSAVDGRPTWTETNERPALFERDEAVATAGTDDAELRRRAERTEAVDNMALVLGRELMTRWVIPFEVAGLLLTAALVGAIALAMSDRPDEPPRRGAVATTRSGVVPGPAAATPAAPTHASGSPTA